MTQEELSLAAAGAHYTTNNPETGAYANLTYAVMAKRAQEMDHEGSRTYGEALVSLANGENPHDTPEFLGLQDKVKSVDINDVKGKNGVVAWGNGHCIYVDTESGKTYGDAWGDQRDYNGTNYTGEKQDKLTDAYIFT